MSEIFFKDESFKLIGACMEVHNQLGIGFKEVIYKDALEIELVAVQIPFERERSYKILYKNVTLRRRYVADYVVYGSIILEVKPASHIVDSFTAQTINYLKASGLKLGIIVNFGEKRLNYKRVVF